MMPMISFKKRIQRIREEKKRREGRRQEQSRCRRMQVRWDDAGYISPFQRIVTPPSLMFMLYDRKTVPEEASN